MKRLTVCLMLVLFCGNLWSAEAIKEKTEKVPEDAKKLVRGNNAFAFEMYRKLATDNKKNMFFSPTSISTALAMT